MTFKPGAAPADTVGFSPLIPKRRSDHNPRGAHCPLHLRRICGACAHYQGQLRPVRDGHDTARHDTAACAALVVTVHRLSDAGHCRRWERKGPANV